MFVPKGGFFFYEIASDEPIESMEEAFRVTYFLSIVDNAISSLKSRFEQFQRYEYTFGFLFNLSKLSSSDTESLKYFCDTLETFLQHGDNYGIDVSDIYDPDNILDTKKRQLQEDQLDNASLEDLAQKIQDKVDMIKSTYVDDSWGEATQAGDGITELLEELEKNPEVGVSLYGPLINTVTRGARLKKFYLRSAPTGVGKSRTMIADCCYIGCNRIYDDVFGWIKNGICEPTLYITTEQELGEIQTMMLAFISNVNEEHILNGRYEGDERERVYEAGNILKNSPIYIEVLPDFSLQDVENKIKKNIRDHDVKYVFNPQRVKDCVTLFQIITGVYIKYIG